MRIERLLRRERGERLFTAVQPDGHRVLLFQIAGADDGKDEAERLKEVAESMARIHSVHVPQVVSHEVKEGNVLHLVTADPGGVFLADIVEGGQLPLPEAVTFWDNLLTAVAPLHAEGLPYGLIHPERLLINRRSQVILPEAGLVAALGPALQRDLPSSGSLFQRLFVSPDLVPPELLRSSVCDPRSDIYQAAVLFFRLVTGGSPFGEGLSLEIYNRMSRHQSESLLEVLPEVGPGLASLIDKCLHPEPGKRPATVAEVRSILLSCGVSRQQLAERIVARPEKQYADRFPGILAIHAGGDQVSEELTESGLDGPIEFQKNILLDQLEQLKSRRSSPAARSVRWGTWITLSLLVIAVVLGLPYLLELTHFQNRNHEGEMPVDSDGLTHRELVWNGDEGQPPHPTVRSMMQSISGPLQKSLEKSGVTFGVELTFVSPVLPPYRVRSRDSDGLETQFEFTARNRLFQIILPVPIEPGIPSRVFILYDGDGAPQALDLRARDGIRLQITPVTQDL